MSSFIIFLSAERHFSICRTSARIFLSNLTLKDVFAVGLPTKLRVFQRKWRHCVQWRLSMPSTDRSNISCVQYNKVRHAKLLMYGPFKVLTKFSDSLLLLEKATTVAVVVPLYHNRISTSRHGEVHVRRNTSWFRIVWQSQTIIKNCRRTFPCSRECWYFVSHAPEDASKCRGCFVAKNDD